MVHADRTQPIFVDVNVLPRELRPRRYRLWLVLGVAVLLSAGPGLSALHGVVQAARVETAGLQQRLDVLNGDLRLVQQDVATVSTLRQELEAAEIAIADLLDERREVVGEQQELSRRLSAAALSLPPGASLGPVTGSDREVRRMTLTGRARGARDVLEYADVLRRGAWFSAARITSLAIADLEQPEEGDPGVTFTIETTW